VTELRLVGCAETAAAAKEAEEELARQREAARLARDSAAQEVDMMRDQLLTMQMEKEFRHN
jgi:hypothetical protein